NKNTNTSGDASGKVDPKFRMEVLMGVIRRLLRAEMEQLKVHEWIATNAPNLRRRGKIQPRE
ncbi:Hypothetical predicted protein, partial [Olea europaea subsp. europaea]